MRETEKLARTVRNGIYVIFAVALWLSMFQILWGDDDPTPKRVYTYCDETTKVYVAGDGSVDLLPASIDCTPTTDQETGG